MSRYIWLKELRGELYTWKSTLWLVISSLLFSFTSYVLLTNKELSLLDQTELLWILSKIIISVGFLVVTIDASSIITTEFEKETAESLFLTPLTLKDFILGKILASATLWFLIVIIAIPYITVSSAGTGLALAFAGYVLLFGTLGTLGLILLIFSISFLYRSSKNTLTTSLIILLIFTIPALFSSNLMNNYVINTFSKINPVSIIFACLDNVLVDFKLSILSNMHYLIPLLVFTFITLFFLLLTSRKFSRQGVIKND
jgi:ABC-type Na+ efflux pump permease subunit